MKKQKSGCNRCGTCCNKGGPALHTEDYHLIASGILTPEDLITVRAGEYVYLPLADDPHPSPSELVKIRGKGSDWCCLYFDARNAACLLYENRPIACRLLKCWDPVDILAVAGKDLLDRLAVIADDDPVAELIQRHEEKCPVTMMNILVEQARDDGPGSEALKDLTGMVLADLRFRELAVAKYRFSIERELFYFGRPIFHLLLAFGMEVVEKEGRITVETGAV